MSLEIQTNNVIHCNNILNACAEQFIKIYDVEYDEVPDEFKTNPYFDEIDETTTYYIPENKKYDDLNHIEIKKNLSLITDNFVHIVFNNLENDYAFEDLIYLPKTTETIYLGHDGVIDILHAHNTDEDHKKQIVRNIINKLSNLKEIYYCTYYFEDIDMIIDIIKELNRNINCIEIE